MILLGTFDFMRFFGDHLGEIIFGGCGLINQSNITPMSGWMNNNKMGVNKYYPCGNHIMDPQPVRQQQTMM